MTTAPLTWTTAAPTVPGYYWYRGRYGLSIGQVKQWDNVTPLVMYELGVDEPEPVDRMSGEWAGPIPEPAG